MRDIVMATALGVRLSDRSYTSITVGLAKQAAFQKVGIHVTSHSSLNSKPQGNGKDLFQSE